MAVVGAGAAGLATAREAVRQGHCVTVFEQSDGVAGVWVYDPRVDPHPSAEASSSGAHAALYPSLRTNLPRALMGFVDLPFDDVDGPVGSEEYGRPLRAFPTHHAVRRYLERFCDDHGLRPLVRFGCRVTRVFRHAGAPAGASPDWRVRVASPDVGSTTHAFDAVAVCNGHYWAPRVAHLPGAAPLATASLHSHSYRGPAPFVGRRVLVLGAGASGVDLAIEVASVARSTLLCSRKSCRDVSPRGWEARHAPLERLDERGCPCLTDGRSLPAVDSILYCTGYEYSFPFLDEALAIRSGEYVSPLYRDLIWVDDARLAFVGLPYRVIPFPQFEVQARYWIGALSGAHSLPGREERARWRVAHERALTERGVTRRHFLRHAERQFDYHQQLAAACGGEPLPAFFPALERQISERRVRDPAGYRDHDFDWPTAAPGGVPAARPSGEGGKDGERRGRRG